MIQSKQVFFGKVLSELMKEKNLSPKEVGALCGYKNDAVTQWCRGTTVPHAKVLIILADYFNVSVDYLLGRTDNLFVQIGNAEVHMSCEEKERFQKLRRLNKKELDAVDEFIAFKLEHREK